jgi:hypothetical protein
MSKQEYVICILVSIGAFAFFALGIDSWRFSFVGDSLHHYEFARQIVLKNFRVNPFSMHGVFGQERLQSSLLQALFMKIFGLSHISWRLANVVTIIPAIFIFRSYLNREFKDSSLTLISIILLGSSYYLANFFKIGYSHPTSFLLFLASLEACSKVKDLPNKRNFFILGTLLGVSFYHYIGPIFPFILLPYIVSALFFQSDSLTESRARLCLSFFTPYITIIALSVLTEGGAGIAGALSKTTFNREFDDSQQFFINIGRNFFVFWRSFDYWHNHFVAGPYLDLISGVLAVVGVSIAICKIGSDRNLSIFFYTWIALVCVIGLSNPYRYTPATRGIFFIPFGVVFAALGLRAVREYAKPTLLVFMVVALNVYRSQIGVFNEVGINPHAHALHEILKLDRAVSEVIIWQPEKSWFFVDGLYYLTQLYGRPITLYSVRDRQALALFSSQIPIFVVRNNKQSLVADNNLSYEGHQIVEIDSFTRAAFRFEFLQSKDNPVPIEVPF